MNPIISDKRTSVHSYLPGEYEAFEYLISKAAHIFRILDLDYYEVGFREDE